VLPLLLLHASLNLISPDIQAYLFAYQIEYDTC
jgi:hypothetical protein